MSYRDWVRNSRGEWYVIAQTALMALVLVSSKLDGRPLSFTDPSGIAAIGLIAIGFAFILSGSFGLGRNLSPFPRPKMDGRLVETGVFGLVRHPIYTGLTLLAVGWSLFSLSIAAGVATIALFLFFDVKARREEQWLEEKFENYRDYKTRVRKLVPFIY